MENKIEQSMIMDALDWSYEKAVGGLPGFDSAQELAESYLKKNQNPDDAINSLIRWQNAKAATSGFITGLGGAIVLPVSLPANITSVLYVQIRTIAAVAHIKGYDLNSDQVKTLVYSCLLGSAAFDTLKDVGIKVGTKLSEQAIKNMSRKIIIDINQKVGFRLVTKFGEKGVINLGKAIPILGGFIGGTFDAFTTHSIGKISKKVFV
jgi:hypothetical protein